MKKIMYDNFKNDIKEIKDDLINIDKKDIINHYNKIKLWSNSFYWIGLFTLFLSPYTIYLGYFYH